MAPVSFRPAVPTMPGVESSFWRSPPSHAGQAGARLAVTKASNWRPQPRQAYSNMGMTKV
jgi:hypothetical protein